METGNQKLRQLPVHLMVPPASCSGVYRVFPAWSVSTVPTPVIWRAETVIPLVPGAPPVPLAVGPAPLALLQAEASPATATAARTAASGPPGSRPGTAGYAPLVLVPATACVNLLIMMMCLLSFSSRLLAG